MIERAYAVAEIDDLRRAAETRWMWGTTRQPTLGENPSGNRMVRTYLASEKFKAVEEMVRTYMLAGITATDIYEQDNPALKARNEATTA